LGFGLELALEKNDIHEGSSSPIIRINFRYRKLYLFC